MKRWQLWILAPLFVISTLLVSCSTTKAQSQEKPLRIGLLGDSSTDEYRGTDSRGGTYGSSTYNWIEQIIMNRNVSAGAWDNWPEPRRQGYEYNWARSAATAHSLIESGQHTGLAEQISQGAIDIAIISIGINDFGVFNDNYTAIYSGQISGDALDKKISDIVADFTTAVDAIQAAGDIPVILTTIPDQSLSPSVINDDRFTDADKRLLVSEAIHRANSGIVELANERGLLYLDYDSIYTSLYPQIVNGFNVGGVSIDILAAGDEPHHGVLGDSTHLGTVMGGFIANKYLEIINEAVDPDIPLLTDAEIIKAAGLTP